jgi:hypothetical protein
MRGRTTKSSLAQGRPELSALVYRLGNIRNKPLRLPALHEHNDDSPVLCLFVDNSYWQRCL